MKQRTCLVTGGAGFIGSYVVKSLMDRGHRAVSFDMRDTSPWLKTILSERQQTEMIALTGDITDPRALERAVEEHGAGLLCSINTARQANSLESIH